MSRGYACIPEKKILAGFIYRKHLCANDLRQKTGIGSYAFYARLCIKCGRGWKDDKRVFNERLIARARGTSAASQRENILKYTIRIKGAVWLCGSVAS